MNEITLTYDELTNIVNSSLQAFINTGKYYLSMREAQAQFGNSLINQLVTNKLITDNRPIKAERVRCKFLLSDIITAIETYKKLGAKWKLY